MKSASTISVILHGAVLAWGLITFTGKNFEVTPAESMPVDIISAEQFSQLTKGVKEAPKVEAPKPLVEKKAEPKPAEEITPKITEKKEIAASASSPPLPQSKPAEEKSEQKPDPIAAALKKEENKPLPPKKPAQNEPKFDANKIAALLDKRAPQRNAATGEMPHSAPALGTALGNAARLSQSELDALRARLIALWNPPVGAQDTDQYQITIRIRFKRDGTLAVGPQVLTSGSGARFNAMRDSAVRAVLVGQPFTMLRPEHYDAWQEIDINFDTKDMFHDIPLR